MEIKVTLHTERLSMDIDCEDNHENMIFNNLDDYKMDVINKMSDLMNEYPKSIWLIGTDFIDLAHSEMEEVFITQNWWTVFTAIANDGLAVEDFLLRKHPKAIVYIQRYESFEDAYAVARDLRETNERCYAL